MKNKRLERSIEVVKERVEHITAQIPLERSRGEMLEVWSKTVGDTSREIQEIKDAREEARFITDVYNAELKAYEGILKKWEKKTK